MSSFKPMPLPKDFHPENSLTENSLTVLAHRYLLRDDKGQVSETPNELFWRVACHIARGEAACGKTKVEVEQWARTFYELLTSLRFMPNSPTLMNAGQPLGQLSACFVLPIQDSLESIFDTLKHAALIHQSGGGTGFSFSNLRPQGDRVNSTMGVSSGPVSFMKVYNAATEAVKQGGTRRGANMGILRIDHPDIEAFIHCKRDLDQITNFNISIAITDAFMHAVETDSDFPLIHPGSRLTVKNIPARKLFDQIVKNAWLSGEPGLVFIDRINQDNPTPAIGLIESTNPCGEVPLLPYEACNLGSIHLGRFLKETDSQTVINWESLAETVTLAVRFLDNVITQNQYPLPKIEEQVLGNRKIGLGVMGWADLLLALGIPYDTEEATTLAREVASWIDYHSKQASVALAKERGSFPNFPKSPYAIRHWLTEKHGRHPTQLLQQSHWEALDRAIHQEGLRNATTTCIAPTGTISIIAGASGGIEPLFSVAFNRHVLDGEELTEAHPLFLKWLATTPIDKQKTLLKITQAGTLAHLEEVPESMKRLFVTAHDISPHWHILMQEAFQEFTDNAVSKTINFPEDAKQKDIAEAYWQGFRSRTIKGLTVYRDNSRQNQPMSLEGHPDTFGSSTCLECD